MSKIADLTCKIMRKFFYPRTVVSIYIYNTRFTSLETGIISAYFRISGNLQGINCQSVREDISRVFVNSHCNIFKHSGFI